MHPAQSRVPIPHERYLHVIRKRRKIEHEAADDPDRPSSRETLRVSGAAGVPRAQQITRALRADRAVLAADYYGSIEPRLNDQDATLISAVIVLPN